MSVILQAPLPSLETTTVLPNPEFNDGEAGRRSIQTTRAMDGTIYTYVKTSGTSKLNYTFVLSRMKALELRAFITAYFRAKIRLRNHKGELWDVYFLGNPFEFRTEKAARGAPGSESATIVLEMEGAKISG